MLKRIEMLRSELDVFKSSAKVPSTFSKVLPVKDVVVPVRLRVGSESDARQRAKSTNLETQT